MNQGRGAPQLQPGPRETHPVVQWLVAVLLVVALGWLSKTFTRGADQVSTIWLVNGLLVGIMLSAPWSRWPGLLVAGVLGNALSSLLVGDSLDAALRISAALVNVVEVAVAAYPLRRSLADPSELARPRTFLRFTLLAALLAPAVSGAMVLVWGRLVRDMPLSLASFQTWFVAHALGMITMAPVVLAFRKEQLRRLFRRTVLPGTLLMLVALVGITTLVFWQTKFPLLFLIYPPLLVVSMRAGFAGTVAAILLVVLIAVGFTTSGHGPLVLIPGTNPIGRLLILQLFIAVLVLSLLPIVVALSERRREQRAARQLQARYQLLAAHVSDVVVLADHSARRLYVSPAVEEVFGWTPEEFMEQSYRDMVHPDDVDAVWKAFYPEDDNWTKLTVVYRGHRRDGKEIWIEAQVGKFDDEQLAQFGIDDAEEPPHVERRTVMAGRVVTLRDITRRRATEEALELANRELASLVWKDGLTGLANRRKFDEYLKQEWARALRQQLPISVLILDADHFKIYNDHYGHQLGDRCLIALSDAIAGGLYRPSDLAARYGGEEFVIVLPDTTLEAAHRVAMRIHESLVTQSIEHAGSPYGFVTVSIGVASMLPDADKRAEDLVKAADQALYASKDAGRNRVTVAINS